MKKIFFTIVASCLISCFVLQANAATSSYNTTVRNSIVKYKSKNYTGCIQDLTYVVKKDPSNAVAHYYLASSYMRIGRKDEAIKEFDKVISLGTVPSLTSYSIQAKSCIGGTGSCTYVKLTPDQVKGLEKDPENYLKTLKETPTTQPAKDEDVEIKKLINGSYRSNIHPEANKVIIDTMLKQEKHDLNALPSKSEVPTNDEIAEAVKTLAKIGINPLAMSNNSQAIYPQMNQGNDYASLSMLMGNGQSNNNNNNFMSMLPLLMQQGNNRNPQLNANMIQTMMMSQMMPSLDFDTDNNK